MPRISNTFYRIQKAQEKKCSMEQSHLTVLGHSFSENEIESERTLYIFEHGPIFSCLTTTTIFQRGCHMNGARLHIYWTLKNFRCENVIEKNMHTQWEKEKRWVIEKYMPNWWNSDEVKRLVFFLLLLFWTVCYFILLKWAKINRIHAMKVLSIY